MFELVLEPPTEEEKKEFDRKYRHTYFNVDRLMEDLKSNIPIEDITENINDYVESFIDFDAFNKDVAKDLAESCEKSRQQQEWMIRHHHFVKCD